MPDLRKALIRVAASFPAGSEERGKILTALAHQGAVRWTPEQRRKVFVQDGGRFTLPDFYTVNTESDPHDTYVLEDAKEMVEELDALEVGDSTKFGIGGGWGDPVKRIR